MGIKDAAISALRDLMRAKSHAVVAIDGRCGAGKTTLAQEIERELSCNVVHMDDFFLPAEKRTAEPGGNVDRARFFSEVLRCVLKNERFSYRPFDCKRQTCGEEIEVEPKALTVVEGAYSCHPELWDYYDLHIFLTVDAHEQLRRITARGGAAAAERFRDLWIPMEEKYFSRFGIEDKCEIVIKAQG